MRRSVTQLRVQAYSSQVRQGFHWRHYIVALYQRGNLSRQKLIRAGFGNNNVDTCARVCHSPTGYGLSQTFGTSAGTQDFDSVEHTDVVIIIGANPAAAHPVFASRLKKRLREGAKMIVIDPRVTEMVKSPHASAKYHLPLMPGTNVAVLTALAHVIITEGLADEAFVRERCDWAEFEEWAAFVALPKNSPEATAIATGVDPKVLREAARLFATGGNGAIYYGLGVTEHSQGSTTVMAIANLAMATGNIGRPGVGVNPLRGQNNVQGSCDMGSFPHELPGYRHISGDAVREQFEHVECQAEQRAGSTHSEHVRRCHRRHVHGNVLSGRGHSPIRSEHLACRGGAVVDGMRRGPRSVPQRDSELRTCVPAGSTFLEKDGTFTNAERRIQRVRKVMTPLNGYADWEITIMLAKAMGYNMHYDDPSQIMDEIAALTPTFTGVSYKKLEELGSVQWPCNEKGARRYAGHAHRPLCAWQG
jgi:formate dehydrogenase major subunit